MDPKRSPKLSRRDAIKLLGAAAGASVLANLPSKWNAPQLTTGVLPAHAQTSGLHSLHCNDFGFLVAAPGVRSTVDISPADPGILMHYEIVLGGGLTTSHALTGSAPADGSGTATVEFPFSGGSGSITVTWSFVNPSDGTGDCSTSVTLD